MIESLGQKRMKAAFQQCDEVENYCQGKLADTCSKFRTRLRDAPVFIHDAGLLQVLVFSMSKTELAYRFLAASLLRWALGFSDGKLYDMILPGYVDSEAYGEELQEKLAEKNLEMFKGIMDKEPLQLLKITDECVAFLEWLKRFAEARFKEEKEID